MRVFTGVNLQFNIYGGEGDVIRVKVVVPGCKDLLESLRRGLALVEGLLYCLFDVNPGGPERVRGVE